MRLLDASPRVDAWMRYEVATEAFRAVSRALREERIEALPVKGIITARRLYSDVADRPMMDVDLRVRRGDFRRVLALARTRGWTITEHTPRLWEAALRLPRVDIDIEATIGPPGLCTIDVGEMIERATSTTDLYGFSHLEPEVNDHAIVMLVNVFKDMLERTHPWSIEDLSRIQNERGFSPEIIVRRAKRGQIGTAVWIVADWLARERGLERWIEVRDLLGKSPPSPRYARMFVDAARRRIGPKAQVLLTAAGADAIEARARGALLGLAGLAYGGVMRRLTSSHSV